MKGLRFVLIGHPIGHSISPLLHATAYGALGLQHRYEAVDAPDEAAVRALFAELRHGAIAGANVTVPHKRLALALADRAEASAARAGAANVLVRAEDGTLTAHNTDVGALADELRALCPGAASAVIVGAGGAALAAAAACAVLGISDVVVTARRFADGEPAGGWPGAAALAALGARPLAWPAAAPGDPEALLATAFGRAAAGAALVIQATSAGMRGADAGQAVRDVIPWGRLAASAAVYDVVYNPRVTPFLHAAGERGLRRSDGLGMLVGQAGAALALWLGVEPPLVAMTRAAEHALGAAR